MFKRENCGRVLDCADDDMREDGRGVRDRVIVNNGVKDKVVRFGAAGCKDDIWVEIGSRGRVEGIMLM